MSNEVAALADLQRLHSAWPDHPDIFTRHCRSIARWGPLLALAEQHGTLGVLAQPLLTGGNVPNDISVRITERRALECLWSEQLLTALRQALRALTSANVTAIALKGPILSERLYGGPSLRHSGDLDLLVLTDQFATAEKALTDLGYRTETGPTAVYRQRYHHHLDLIGPQGLLLELHFRTFAGFGTILTAEDSFSRAIPYQSGVGCACHILSPEDEILYLCIHAAGHGFARLAWLCDIKAFLAKHPSLDWSLIVQRAFSQGVAVPLAAALEILHERLGTTISVMPTVLKKSIGRRRLAARLLPWLDRQAPVSPLGTAGLLIYQALLCDRPKTALAFFQHHFGRIARRRLQRGLPSLFPQSWSG